MTNRSTRLLTLVCLISTGLLSSVAPAAAVSFAVHDYELGEKIELTDGRRVWTAELDVTLGDRRGKSFCVDIDTHISRGSYETRAILDAYTSPSPADERVRNFAWAGHVMASFGHDISMLTSLVVSRAQAITGVQAAIWEGIYGGGIVKVDSLSNGAHDVFREIMNSPMAYVGSPVIAELRGNQDQVFSNPVPEPTAATIFAIGMLVVGSAVRRKSN